MVPIMHRHSVLHTLCSVQCVHTLSYGIEHGFTSMLTKQDILKFCKGLDLCYRWTSIVRHQIVLYSIIESVRRAYVSKANCFADLVSPLPFEYSAGVGGLR